MSMHPSGIMMGDRRDLDDPLMDNENMSDDDNAQPDIEEQEVEKEDPLLLAIDDLQGRVVSALDEVKIHTGVRSSSVPGSPTIHEELSTLLRPVLEVAAHTGPSVARTYYHGVGSEGVEASVEDVYQRIICNLVLPVMLEMVRSDTIAAKRVAALEFFRQLWKESQKAGSWLDTTTSSPQAGPYGPGGSHHVSTALNPTMRAQQKRRQGKRLAREGDFLRYWIEASITCTMPGVFTSEEAETVVASRGIIAASASLRPTLQHIAQRIKDADDRGANRLYSPLMKMIEGVLKKLFLSTPGESIRSSCIKFLEIVVLCCSRRPNDPASRRRGQNMTEGFALDDLPAGHPIITQQALESIAEYAFTTIRGLTLLGGQVRIDVNLLSDLMLTGGGDGSPSEQIVSILKPAALAYLDIEEALPKIGETENVLDFELDFSSIEFEFMLSQKSYALTINAMSALAINRPVFFMDAAICLARRAVTPPVFVEGGSLTKAAVLAIVNHLKASCLTLLRNALSVTTNACHVLHIALKTFDMEIQADKALKMANQATELKTAGRAARNRANMYYEWDASESDRRTSKRQRETDDALALMRAAKAARGLGHGIKLPTSMSDSLDLIMMNLSNLPAKRPSGGPSKTRKIPYTLEVVIDAIMTNGASLVHEEGLWYERDGGTSWECDFQSVKYCRLSSSLSEVVGSFEDLSVIKAEDEKLLKRQTVFMAQSHRASADAVGRILASSSSNRSRYINDLGNQLAARLAFTLGRIQPSKYQEQSHTMVSEITPTVAAKTQDVKLQAKLSQFVDQYPLAAAGIVADGTVEKAGVDLPEPGPSLSANLLNEASVQYNLHTDSWMYDCSLALLVGSIVHACELNCEKPVDNERRKAAARVVSILQRQLLSWPRITKSSVTIMCALCDTREISKKAAESSKKVSDESIQTSAAIHAAKVSADKRATGVLLLLRDIAFQFDSNEIRDHVVRCAVKLATGTLPSGPGIQEKALKLVMNVVFSKNEILAQQVINAATAELEAASNLALQSYDIIEKARNEAGDKDTSKVNPNMPQSEDEKQVLDKLRPTVVLYMALCVRRPDIIPALFTITRGERMAALTKSIRGNMSKLSRAVASKYGAATVAQQVADVTSAEDAPMLLAFLDNMVPSSDKSVPDQDFIDACFKIQRIMAGEDGSPDPRYIIPVLASMTRKKLCELLSDFVRADDNIFLAALVRMGDRVGRQALWFRDEADSENPTLLGMTLCEQLVYLHKLDFASCGLPQKRYLAAIKLCLEEEEVYNDRVLMSALDHMSGTFLTGNEKLPLAFMRTCILVCTKHESLTSWICHVLLPRLVEGKIYEDPRQWEGWMRCAHMLEKSDDAEVNSVEAIEQLPDEQRMQYQVKWAGK